MKIEETEKGFKRYIEHAKKQKYMLSLPVEYKDDRTIEFTQKEIDDTFDKLTSQSQKKFSISLIPEYVEILDDVVKREKKQWGMVKRTRNGIINEAIREYIIKRGYIVTQDMLCFQELSELEPLMALCKDAKKISDFPPWVRGYWVRSNPFGSGVAEYIGTGNDQEVEKWFNETFAEINKKNKAIKI